MKPPAKYKMSETVPQLVKLLGNEADGWAALPFHEAVDDLKIQLENVVRHLNPGALPPVYFDTWYAEAVGSVRHPGMGVLHWPSNLAERLTVMLRLLWNAATISGYLGGFNVAFVPGTNFTQPDDHRPLLERVLKPFVKHFDLFVQSGLVTLYEH